MNLSYRTRRRLRSLGIATVVVIVTAIVVWMVWVVWAGRFISYHRGQGAKLDFGLSAIPEGVKPTPPAAREPIDILYDEPDIELPTPVVDETSIHGYYVDFEKLKTNFPTVRDQIRDLPRGTAVLLDLKNIKGLFHYSTTVGTTTAKDVNVAQIDALLAEIAKSDLHVIARIPAFRDWEYGLNHVPSGLPKKDGDGSLWMDDSNCYWLDPTNEDALSYLMDITMELRLMGIDEVVYTDFRFPKTEKIEFKGDKDQAIADAAATIAATCASDRFWVSFQSADPTFPLPSGNCRLYLEDIPASDLPTVVPQVKTDDPAVHLLFLATVNDTRFDEYCVLRPLDSAH